MEANSKEKRKKRRPLPTTFYSQPLLREKGNWNSNLKPRYKVLFLFKKWCLSIPQVNLNEYRVVAITSQTFVGVLQFGHPSSFVPAILQKGLFPGFIPPGLTIKNISNFFLILLYFL